MVALPDQIRRILVPTDFSELSREAIPVAERMAGPQTEIHLLHVNQPVVAYAQAGGVMPATPSPMVATTQQLQQQLLEIELSDGKTVHREVTQGYPAASIVDYAAKADIDLIVMTTHGTTGLARLVMGSVAEGVVRDAECPVLTLKHRTS